MKNTTLLHVPHSSTVIPEQYLGSFRRSLLRRELDVMTDWFCDELFDCGREKIVFPISRLVCDVERFRSDADEIMAKIGMGAVYRSASDLAPFRFTTEGERQEILARYYDTHHRLFTQTVDRILLENGRCLIVDGHSFYPTPLPYEMDQSADRPDFCIGTSPYHTPEVLSETIVSFLTAQGFRVKINSPFAGTIVPLKHYGKDGRVISVMIEVNRKLYLAAPGVRSDRFPVIRAAVRGCVETAERFLR